MASLRYFDHEHVLHTRTLTGDKFVIGRIESCQICITDDLTSREHARLDRDPDGRYRIRDLGSRNKTFVGGEQINETLLSGGDMVRIGHHVFEFLDDSVDHDLPELSFLTPDRVDPAGTEWIKSSAAVTVSLERHAALAMLGVDTTHPARAEDVADGALGRLLLAMRADRGMIAMRGDKKKDMRLVAHRGMVQAAGGSLKPVSQTFFYSAALQSVAGRYPQSAGQIDAKSGFAATAMVAPLLHGRDVMGIVYIDRPSAGAVFSETNLQEMGAAGAQIGALMADATERLTRNMQSAKPPWLATLRRMQFAMTVKPEAGPSFAVATKLMSGAARCGDFCDIIHVGDERTYVLVVDAGGHGVSGLAHGNGIRSAVRTALTLPGAGHDLADIMSTINGTFLARQARQLVTCTLVGIDLAKGQISYVNAGGPPPLLLSAPGRLITLDQPSLVLGIDPNYGYESAAVDLPASFRLLCHTDGLPEMTNAAGKALESDRVHELLLEKDLFADPSAIITRIVALCDKHRAGRPPDDDALIAVLSRG